MFKRRYWSEPKRHRKRHGKRHGKRHRERHRAAKELGMYILDFFLSIPWRCRLSEPTSIDSRPWVRASALTCSPCLMWFKMTSTRSQATFSDQRTPRGGSSYSHRNTTPHACHSALCALSRAAGASVEARSRREPQTSQPCQRACIWPLEIGGRCGGCFAEL